MSSTFNGQFLGKWNVDMAKLSVVLRPEDYKDENGWSYLGESMLVGIKQEYDALCVIPDSLLALRIEQKQRKINAMCSDEYLIPVRWYNIHKTLKYYVGSMVTNAVDQARFQMKFDQEISRFARWVVKEKAYEEAK